MCAAFELNGKASRPGKPILARSDSGMIQKVWAGFARSEILNWWRSKGAVELDIFANRFAERSQKSGKLLWGEIPQGQVIRGLVIPQPKPTEPFKPTEPLVKILTRQSTLEELARFEHPRMPVLDSPLYGPIPSDLLELSASPQGELF